ncbi:MAG: hypothetical protein P8Y01_12620 [Woeseiaceae bacterium]
MALQLDGEIVDAGAGDGAAGNDVVADVAVYVQLTDRSHANEVRLVEDDGGTDRHQLGRAKIAVDDEPVGFRRSRGDNAQVVEICRQYFDATTCVRSSQLIAALFDTGNQPFVFVGQRFDRDEVAADRLQPLSLDSRIGLRAVREKDAHASTEGCGHRGTIHGGSIDCGHHDSS